MITRHPLTLKVRVPAGEDPGFVEVAPPVRRLSVGEQITPEFTEALGLESGRFTERILAFVALVALEWLGVLRPRFRNGREEPQRERFADHLGLNPWAFRKFIERTFRPNSGRVLSWDPRAATARQSSWTGGPWWLRVREVHVAPSPEQALRFIERIQSRALYRRRDPEDLLRDALAERRSGNWSESLALLQSAAAMFRDRRWSRKEPLWFDILLLLSGTEMQIGREGLWPRVPINIRISVKEQGLRGPGADLIRARAHYIAALMYNQAGPLAPAKLTLRELRRCRELLLGRRDRDAEHEFWKASSYEEITRARLGGVVVAPTSSAILEAGRVIEESREQKRMRYGETLLYGGYPARGLDYVDAALASGELVRPAQVIGQRLKLAARWLMGEKPSEILAALGEIEKEAHELGFAHQVRVIRGLRERVRRGNRSLTRA